MSDNDTKYDGVRPQDYPETYSKFLTHFCFRQKSAVPVFFANSRFDKLLCGDCYHFRGFPENEQIDIYTNWHVITPTLGQRTSCDNCHKEFFDKKPIIDCGTCTDQLLKQLHTNS